MATRIVGGHRRPLVHERRQNLLLLREEGRGRRGDPLALVLDVEALFVDPWYMRRSLSVPRT
jgi:hypothetical protein